MIEEILSSSQQIYIYAKDKNSKYIFCNEALAEVAGVDSPKQVIGKTDRDFVWKPNADLYVDGDHKVFQGRTVRNVVEPHVQKTKVLTILTTKTLLKNKNDEVYAVAGHSVDITGYTLSKNSGEYNHKKKTFYLGAAFNNEYLTRREFQIFKYLLEGYSVEKIASLLTRSRKTIETQIKSIANKLQCSHKSEIVPTAIKFGLTHILEDTELVKTHS